MSKIQWTDETWNPVTGCSKISEGCANCYAERMIERLGNIPQTAEKYKDGFKVTCHNDELKRRFPGKGKKIFVCSMSDLFHDDVPFEFIDKVMNVIGGNPQHVFQMLTKRPARMREYFDDRVIDGSLEDIKNGYLKNLWLGVTCENQRTTDERIPLLLEIPAAIRFISVEPMLGAVDLGFCPDVVTGECDMDGDCNCCNIGPAIYRLDWVICGGESGVNARPLNPDWVISLRDQCIDAGVPFFFKQWGEWAPALGYNPKNKRRHFCFDPPSKATPWLKEYNGLSLTNMFRYGKKKAGNRLHGEVWEQFPKQSEAKL